MIRTALLTGTAALLIIMGFPTVSPCAPQPLTSWLFQNEPEVVIASHAQDGGAVAFAGVKSQMMLDETRFIAVYNERTGLETWRMVAGAGHWVQVAMAQGRVCAAGNRMDPSFSAPLLIIGCYAASDGRLLWETEFDVSLPGFLSVNTTPAAVTMSGKTLVVRTGGNPMGFGAIVSLLLDPDTGAAK